VAIDHHMRVQVIALPHLNMLTNDAVGPDVASLTNDGSFMNDGCWMNHVLWM
jgi:hypothetical protein